MRLIYIFLIICFANVALCYPKSKASEDDDEFEEKPSRWPSLNMFGGAMSDTRNLFDRLFRSFNQMFVQQMNSARNILQNFGRGFGFNFNDVTGNATVNRSESHTKQVGNNLVITNITHLDKVSKDGKKYRIINKNVRVVPVNGSQEILNSDRTYVIMDPDDDQIEKGNHRNITKSQENYPKDKFSEDYPHIKESEDSPRIQKEDYPHIKISESTSELPEREDTNHIPPETITKKQWEKVDPNVMFDPKRNLVITDVESNDIKK